MVTVTLLDLPNELIIQILSNLTHQDLISCQLSNSALFTVIKDSVLLQFRIALSTFKATDNPSCPLSVSERLRALKASEEAWTSLRENFRRSITVNHEPSSIYDLTGGVFLLGNAARTTLHYIKLPSSAEDEVDWKKVQLDPSEGTIIDMGFCLHEHDLLAVVTTKTHSAQLLPTTYYDVKIVLLQFSTGKPHPAAKQSTIHVSSSTWERPAISIEIVGDHLVLMLTYRDNDWMPDDRVFVYDWRNAVQKMSFSVPCSSYHALTFLSENLFLIPNTLTNTLEIWDIFSDPNSPRPVCILGLPELVTGNSLAYISCRGEPNPIGSGSRPQSDRPFYQSSEDAIILFHIRVALENPIAHQLQHGGDLVLACTYKLFVHRKALLAICDQHCAEVEASRFSVGDESSGLDEMIVEDDGDGCAEIEESRFRVEDENSGLDEMIVEDDDDDDDWSSSTGYINTWESVESENEDNVVIRASNEDPIPIPIPWSSWGPPVTRWFRADNSTRWITTTAGQRSVLMVHPTHRKYVVLDFNPENLRRAENELESSPSSANDRIHCCRTWDTLQTEDVFKDYVVSQLPFVAYTSEKAHVWDGALMDEERILGVQVHDYRIRVIDIHHFG